MEFLIILFIISLIINYLCAKMHELFIIDLKYDSIKVEENEIVLLNNKEKFVYSLISMGVWMVMVDSVTLQSMARIWTPALAASRRA